MAQRIVSSVYDVQEASAMRGVGGVYVFGSGRGGR